MKLYRTADGLILESEERFVHLGDVSWDALFNHPDLHEQLVEAHRLGVEGTAPEMGRLLAPIVSQEVWAAGVTYVRSKTARMEEAREAGGGSFYDRVYQAERPELFFKANPHRVVGPGQQVRVRRDSGWSVPEPELALAVNSRGTIIGYTVGNDMSARDIEGENPLYLPQAKVYDQCCALGPCLVISRDGPSGDTEIQMTIERDDEAVFEGATRLAAMRRTPDELVEFLFRDNSFPGGCFLLTGTGIVPPDAFTLQSGDRIRITIDGIGTLENSVA